MRMFFIDSEGIIRDAGEFPTRDDAQDYAQGIVRGYRTHTPVIFYMDGDYPIQFTAEELED
jgi:hypothetical protein